jgi:hypothetical protein
MSPVSTDSTQASATGVRRSGRVSKEIPIVLSGGDASGRQFSERTRTLVVSLHGASVICHHKLIPEQEAYLRVISNNREIEVRVCGEIGEREDGYIYGVAFADVSSDFWKIEFPPAEALPKDLIPVTLECSGCHRQTDLQFDATEMDVYMVNEGALRYCSQCSVSTIWKIATEKKAPPKPPVPRPIPVAAEAKPAAPAAQPLPVVMEPVAVANVAASQPNRRSERRTRMKFNACIRASGLADEIVPGEDMSRGGFSFHSSRRYAVDTMIEAAVPYNPGAISIFVPAQIANVHELQNGKLFRYGVAYIRAPKK